MKNSNKITHFANIIICNLSQLGSFLKFPICHHIKELYEAFFESFRQEFEGEIVSIWETMY
jgi:hypothetical protein